MEIYFGQDLVDLLRAKCNQVKERIWISSPYLGSDTAILKILGKKWLTDPFVSIRLLTDQLELGRLNIKTIDMFRKRGKVHHLRGLHAKIYIIDDQVLITSANLTETAFSKRYEIGYFLNPPVSREAISIFETWWESYSKEIPIDWVDKIKQKAHYPNAEDQDGKGMQKLWVLPKLPSISIKKNSKDFLDYEYFCDCYDALAKIYRSTQGRLTNMPLYLEVDGFLDYLFHHDSKPSSPYRKIKGKVKPYRQVSDAKRISEVKKYTPNYREWVTNGHNIKWRLKASKEIQKVLDSNQIQTITFDDIKIVVSHFNCMNSYAINKAKFLNPENNDLQTIRDSWEDLLYGKEDLQRRMKRCKDNINYFGDSAVQELLGFFDPEKYPIRNGNSNSGLRFFGYDVAI